MELKSMSLILYAAYHSLQPCEQVFQQTAKMANPTIDFKVESSYLEEFATAACETTNPDVLWLIAQQESNFRFRIVVENAGEPKTYKAEKAVSFLKSMRKEPKGTRRNVDIGVLQFNWGWHQAGFKQNPLAALSPRKQVDYFLKQYGEEIYRRCDDQWVGCYHNQTDPERGNRYQAAMTKKGKTLALQTLYYLRDYRSRVSAAERALMPVIVKEDFYRIFETVQGFPLPRKQILHFVEEGPLPQQQLIKEVSYPG